MHALVTVLLPRDGSRTIEELMEPYDLNLSAPPRPAECGCAYVARHQAGRAVGEAGGIEEIRRAYHTLPPAGRPTWEAYAPARELLAAMREAEEAIPARPVPDCEWCQGSGRTFLHFNPDGRWDYYCPLDEKAHHWDAGRWPDGIQAEAGAYVTYALLLPDSGWSEDGDIGWLEAREDESWDELFRSTVQRYLATNRYDVVICDYHF